MAYALVINGQVAFAAHDSSALSKYLHETHGINVSLPENPLGAVVAGHTVMPVNYISGVAAGEMTIDGHEYVVSGAVVERKELSRPMTLDEAKAKKIAEIEMARDAATTVNATALDTQWQADERSQKLLSSAITLTTAGLPLPAVWRDAFNNDVPVTSISQLLAIAGAMAVQTQAAYAQSWVKKAETSAATTVEQVNAVTL